MDGKRYALIAPTSIGVRLTPVDFAAVQDQNRFLMQATSAETNVLNVPAALGLPVKALTAFVAGSPIAAFIRRELRRRGIDFEGPERVPDGPWGCRHQFNIADTGFGVRAPRVYNDRAGEVGRSLTPEDFDLPRLFEQEGAQVLHLSGLIAALSPETGRLCLQLAEAAKASGTRVSFDPNYRDSFWRGRETELRTLFYEIGRRTDILFGLLGPDGMPLKPPAAGGEAAQRAAMARTLEAFPNVEQLAMTNRVAHSVGRHSWGAAVLTRTGVFAVAPLREIAVLDRIGGGDGFAGGYLYGQVCGRGPEESLQLGWAAGALAVAGLMDYAAPADEQELWDIWGGDAAVKR